MIERTIAQAVKEALAPDFEAIAARLAVLENPNAPKGKTVMDTDAFCAYTGISKQTVYRKTASGEIPHSKRGKRLYFDKKEIDDWLMSNKVSPERMEDKTEQYFSNKRSSMRQKK